MNEIIQQIENGQFTTMGIYTIRLKSGAEIWVESGFHSYSFYPRGGTSFTFWEKLKLRKALKKGLIKKALADTK